VTIEWNGDGAPPLIERCLGHVKLRPRTSTLAGRGWPCSETPSFGRWHPPSDDGRSTGGKRRLRRAVRNGF
jgi:hypothetical protein